MSSSTRPKLAVGPVMPGWGSWEWVGTFLTDQLVDQIHANTFTSWQIPDADAVVVIKHAPPQEWVDKVTRRSALIYCPIDWYGDSKEIDADAGWLRKCSRVVVHCRRLQPFFATIAETCYLDHPLKFVTPIRKTYQSEGSLLWVGVRSNLQPLVEWVNAHLLPAPLDVLTNPEHPGQVPSPSELGFHGNQEVRIHEWTPERHLQFTSRARAALDIKGDDFRSRHKPPAKALDFVASGLPLAMNPGSSPRACQAALGRKYFLFTGNDEDGRTTAVLYTMTQTCHRHGIDPFSYLQNVLTRLPQADYHQLAELFPHHWATSQRAQLENPL